VIGQHGRAWTVAATPQSSGTEVARTTLTSRPITIAHQRVMVIYQRKLNVMLAAVTSPESGVNGMMTVAMLTVVMDTDVAIGLANQILTLKPLTLTVNQCAMDPMKIIRNAMQDAVTRTSSGQHGLPGSVMCPAAMVQRPDIATVLTMHIIQTLSVKRDADMEMSTSNKTAIPDAVTRRRDIPNGLNGWVM